MKVQGRDPNMFDAHYLENGWRWRPGDNVVPIGNGHLVIIWSRDLKGQGCDLDMFVAYCLENGLR